MGQMPWGQGTEQRRNPRVWLLSASTDRPCEQPGAISRLQSEQAPRRSPRKGDLAGLPHFQGGFGHRKRGSATRGGANPSGSLEKRGKNRVLSAGGSGEALRQRGRERRGGRQAEEMKAAILSCLWLAAWNTPPWRLLPQISLFFCTGKEATSSVPLEGSERRWVCLCLVGFCFCFFPLHGCPNHDVFSLLRA